jgi:hypothetical protein
VRRTATKVGLCRLSSGVCYVVSAAWSNERSYVEGPVTRNPIAVGYGQDIAPNRPVTVEVRLSTRKTLPVE